MTIMYADSFAFMPKKCNKCSRLFWLEPYFISYREVGIEHYPLKQIRCKHCKNKYGWG
jgi:phage FluMu protein Com